MEKITMKVEGMGCAKCEAKVVKALTELGCVHAIANAGDERVDVEFDPATVSRADIENAIADFGYDIS
ncbi:MAG: cation transporter [Defluviitaleaceae bacterium]|nr:cation transporter [Defluviitaleaceae bacterium]